MGKPCGMREPERRSGVHRSAMNWMAVSTSSRAAGACCLHGRCRNNGRQRGSAGKRGSRKPGDGNFRAVFELIEDTLRAGFLGLSPVFVRSQRYGTVRKREGDEAFRRVTHAPNIGQIKGSDLPPIDPCEIGIAKVGASKIGPDQRCL